MKAEEVNRAVHTGKDGVFEWLLHGCCDPDTDQVVQDLTHFTQVLWLVAQNVLLRGAGKTQPSRLKVWTKHDNSKSLLR